jgi:hypothetical protein
MPRENLMLLSDHELAHRAALTSDQRARDALVRVLWARAARQARAGHRLPPAPGDRGRRL